MLFTDSLKYDLLGVSILLIIVLKVYFKWALNYWKRKCLEGPEPDIPFGSMKDVIFGRKFIGELFADIYFELKSKGLRHGGSYLLAVPQYVVVDLKIAKAILQNDFQYFLGHGGYINEKTDHLSANLFNLEGPKWKAIRTKVNPAFSSGKIKLMFHFLLECAENLRKVLDRSCHGEPSEVKEMMGRFTTDVIGSCAFGLKCNSLENPDADFLRQGANLLPLDMIRTIKMFAHFFIPHWLLRTIRFQMESKETIDFFDNIVSNAVSYRKLNKVVRMDFLHSLMQLKNRETSYEDGKVLNGETEETISIKEISANCYLFYLAGYETSSTTACFAIFEMAINTDVQDKARAEVIDVLAKYEDAITYEALMEMNYLECVISETLRKYPPLPMVFRTCTKRYKVPETDLTIDQGTSVIIPIHGIQNDPDYFPDPEKFDPERFSEKNKKFIKPFSYMPFGEGPRICIGMRLGMVQIKLALVTLLKDFRFTLNDRTSSTVTFAKKGIISVKEGGVWVDFQKLQT